MTKTSGTDTVSMNKITHKCWFRGILIRWVQSEQITTGMGLGHSRLQLYCTDFVYVMTNYNTLLLLFQHCGTKGIITLDPPLCAKFVPRISLHIWIKGGLGPIITSVFDRVWPPALCPCSLYSIPPYLLCQVSLAPNCALWIVKMRRLPCCLPWVVGLSIVCDVFAIYMIDKQLFQNAMT